MPGYDRSRVVGVDEDELQEFTCGICLEIFNKPMFTECCGQAFCRDCIDEWLVRNNTCPNDRKPLTINQLKCSPKIVLNLLNNMKIKCDFHENGCNLVLKINELEKHTKDCQFNPCRECDKCGQPQLNHSDQECVKNLYEKFSQLQINYNHLMKKKECSSMNSISHYRINCDGCQTENIRGVRYKCSVCYDYDLCENCETDPSIHNSMHDMIKIKIPRKVPPNLKNNDGDSVRVGRLGTGGDTGINASKLYYCGKVKKQCRCGRCDGRCGPNNGCPCNSCLELIRNREGDKVWKGRRLGTGGDTGLKPPQLYYCGKRKDECRCASCDGRCGPTNGCPCNSCLQLLA